MLVNVPGGYSEMGIYNAASQWRNVMFFLPTILMQAVLPIMSSARSSTAGARDYEYSLRFTQGAMTMIGFPVCTLVMATAHWIMPVYGAGFSTGAPALIGAALSTLIQCIGAAGGPAIESKGKMWLALAINLSYSCFLLSAVYVLLPVSGAGALLFGSAFAYIACGLWTYAYLRRELPVGMFRQVVMSIFFAIMLAGLCLITPHRFSQIFAVPLTACAALVSFRFLVDAKVQQAVLSLLQERHSSRET
jgi:O-antigen/teichoic acid export membrane protein